MPDEVSSPQPNQAVGHAQPGLVERMAPMLRFTVLGTVAGVLAVVTSAAARLTWPGLTSAATGPGWSLVCLVDSVVMTGLAAVQVVCWRRALAVWRGDRSDDLAGLTRASLVAHALSYAAVLLGLWAGIAGSVAAGTSSTSAALLAFALLFLLLAQSLAGVQFLRTDGPSGTIPGHLRRMSAAIQARR